MCVHDEHIILHRFLYNLHNRALCKVNSQEQNKVLSTMTTLLTHTGSPTANANCQSPNQNIINNIPCENPEAATNLSGQPQRQGARLAGSCRTFKRWNGARLLMKRDISRNSVCSLMKRHQLPSNETILKAESIHRTLHQSTHCHTVLRLKACKQRGGA